MLVLEVLVQRLHRLSLGVLLAAVSFKVRAVATPQTEDAVQMVLVTLFQGDRIKAKSAFTTVSYQYERFLNDFVDDGYCGQSIEVHSRCLGIRKSELKQIDEASWSRGFHFAEADFNRNFGIYNFVKEHDLLETYRCVFTLQMTADLETQHVLNKEFIVTCGNRAVPVERKMSVVKARRRFLHNILN